MKLTLGIISAYLVAAGLALAQPTPTPTPPPPARAPMGMMMAKPGAYLGIGCVDITAEKAKSLNLKEERGVEVSSVIDDGPAAKGGVKAGDVVLEFNGTPVQGSDQFRKLVSETAPGRSVKVTVWRS